jgi:hypothetical protein
MKLRAARIRMFGVAPVERDDVQTGAREGALPSFRPMAPITKYV